MNISSQELDARRWAYHFYLGVAGLILIGIVIEGLLIGPSLFTATRWGREVHVYLGAVLFLLALLLPIAARLARLPGRLVLLSTGLFILALLEATSAALGRRTPFLAAVHPANALLMAGLTTVLLVQGWQPMRERRGELKAGQD
jgi:hypothetical protein